jgi:hypothetical protein
MAKARIFLDRSIGLWFYRDIMKPEERCGDGYAKRTEAIAAARKSKRFTYYFSANESSYGVQKFNGAQGEQND